jgi:hypothetical protein
MFKSKRAGSDAGDVCLQPTLQKLTGPNMALDSNCQIFISRSNPWWIKFLLVVGSILIKLDLIRKSKVITVSVGFQFIRYENCSLGSVNLSAYQK